MNQESYDKKDLLRILKKVGQFTLIALVVSGVAVYWAIRIYWWLTVSCLIILGMFIGFLMAINDVLNGTYVPRRGQINFPGLPRFQMPTDLLEKIKKDSPQEIREEIEKSEEIRRRKLGSDERVQRLLVKLDDLASEWKKGQHLFDALSEEEMSILLILLFLANGVEIDFEV